MPSPSALSSAAATTLAVVVLVALVLLGLCCAALLLHPALPPDAWRTGLSAVAVTGVWWLLDGPLEGPTLLVLSRTHGFTVADLAGVPALLAGLAVLGMGARG